MTRPDRAFALGLLSLVPLLTWWLGWFPGFLSSDSLDQLTQVANTDFTNFHPAFHTISMWFVTRLWDSPGMVTLLQALALGVLLAVAARRLVEVGVPLWLGVGTAWVVAVLPAVGPTTVSAWKDIAFGLALLWVFTELLALARQGGSYWEPWANPVRLGSALALVWLYRHNGPITVVLLAAALAIAYRHRWRRLAPAAGALVGIVATVQVVLFPLLDVDRSRPAVAETFIGDVAASYVHEPSNFSAAEVAYLDSIARREVWQELYDCDDSNPILFDARFDKPAIRSDPGPFLTLARRTIVRDLDTVLGHRWCMASYLVVPPQPSSAYLQRPPFEVPANDLGIVRDPMSDRAYQITLDVFQWAEPPGRLWLTWRPALALWLAAGVYAAVAFRPSLRPLLWPGYLLAVHTFNVAATSLTQEFRFAYPLYLMALLSLPLAYLAWRPAQAQLGRRRAAV